jgi:hypothetical protein
MNTRPCARDGCDVPVFVWASPFCSRPCATGKPLAHWEKVAAARLSRPPAEDYRSARAKTTKKPNLVDRSR